MSFMGPIYPKIEAGSAFTKDMNDELVRKVFGLQNTED